MLAANGGKNFARPVATNCSEPCGFGALSPYLNSVAIVQRDDWRQMKQHREGYRMDDNDQQAIEGLFERLARVERQAPPRDPAAEDFIRDRIARQPAAPYFMAQTIVAQKAALGDAQARIEALEAEAQAGSESSGGLFGSLFGGEPSRSPGTIPRVERQPARSGGMAPGRSVGGGFLAGAAQTALGVTGGVLLGNALAGMFGADAEADPAEDLVGQDAFGDDAGLDDFGL